MDIELINQITRYFEDNRIVCPRCRSKWEANKVDDFRLFAQPWGYPHIKVMCRSRCGYHEIVPIESMEILKERYENYKVQ